MRSENDRAVVFYFPDDDAGAVAYKHGAEVTLPSPTLEGVSPAALIFDFQFQHGPTGELVDGVPQGINGLMNEELVELLLLRLRALNDRMPCRENSLAITQFETGLMWLQRRYDLRKAQGVYGTNEPHVSNPVS